jgi:hypothetical protein
MAGIMSTAKETITASTNSTDRPGLAWGASVGVSMIIPCSFTGIERHSALVRDELLNGHKGPRYCAGRGQSGPCLTDEGP